MLLRVAVDPDAPLDLGGRLPGGLLVRYLRDRCVLVFESDESRAALARSSLELPIELRQVVLGLLDRRTETMRRQGTVPLQDLTEASQVATWQELADLLLLAEVRASALDEHSGDLQPEYTTFRDALHARAFDTLADRWQRHAQMGTDREQLWSEVFAPLAARGPTVYITDRYAAWNLYQALTYPAESGRAKRGAQWFLGRLARTRVGVVHLACSADVVVNHGVQTPEVESVIQCWFDRQQTGTRLELHLKRGQFKHNRRIVFDGWAGFEIGNGMSSFDRPQLQEEIELNASVALGSDGRGEFNAFIGQAKD